MAKNLSPHIRVAICQLRMEWSGQANTQSMLQAIKQAADAGARLCVFPELAVTGFHRQIRAEATPDAVLEHLRKVQLACERHSMAVVAGAPTFDKNGRVFNSCAFIDERGELAGVVEKIGLTPAEETFFARGHTRLCVQLLGYRTTAVLCREIDDLDDVQGELLKLSAQIVFWPGAMRPAVDGSATTHVEHAQQLARLSRTLIIQANWPNSLNYPDESAAAGQSVVIGPDGKVLIRLPVAEAGIGIFALGDSRFDWHAQVTTPASPTVELESK